MGLPGHSMSPPATPLPAVSCRREAAVRLRVLNEKTKTDPCPDGERCTDQAACKYYHTKLDQMPKIFFKERYCRIWQVRGHPPAELAGSTYAQSWVAPLQVWIGSCLRSLAAGLWIICHRCHDPPAGRTPCWSSSSCAGNDRAVRTRRACHLLQETGYCAMGPQCFWAHGIEELSMDVSQKMSHQVGC